MSRVIRFYDRLIEGLVTLSGLVIAAVCGLIAWDVVARNLGFQPPESTVALTEYALLYVTMAAGPLLVRQRGHVAVAILQQRFSPGIRAWLERGLLVLCAAVAFLIAALAGGLLLEAVARGEYDTRSFDIPRGWLFAPLVAGFLLMGTEFLRLLANGAGAEAPPATTTADRIAL